jgi:hypothetical protein
VLLVAVVPVVLLGGAAFEARRNRDGDAHVPLAVLPPALRQAAAVSVVGDDTDRAEGEGVAGTDS